MALSRICECTVCGREELTNKTVLPAGWILAWKYPYTLCDTCVAAYEARWGEEMEYYLKGEDEDELCLIPA